MSLFAQFLASVFGGLFSFFAQYFTKKVAVLTTVMATMTAITAAFYLAIKALIQGLMVPINNEWLLMGFYAFWPNNAELCLSACFAAEIAAFIYRMHMDTVRTVAAAQ